MTVVVSKLITVMGFEIDAAGLKEYQQAGRDAQKKMGNELEKTGKRAKKSGGDFGDLAELVGMAGTKAGIAAAIILELRNVLGGLAGTIKGVVTAALDGLFRALAKGAAFVKEFIGHVFKANVEFESLFTRLQTLVGETEAPKIFKQLEEFAAKTPFQLNDILDAFIRLEGLGFDLSGDNRKKLGDLAAASKKTFGELTEIMSSANRGSANMLDNLLGVKAAVKGGKFTVSAEKFNISERTFKVGDQKELMRFLTDLGAADGISGGMERLSNTLGGLLSTLRDNVAGFMRQVGQSGFNDAVRGLFKELNASAGGTESIAKRIGEGLGKIIGFITLTFTKLRSSKIAQVVSRIFGQISAAFDKLSGGKAGRLAKALEMPIDAISAILDAVDGKRGSAFEKWLEKFNNPLTPLGQLSMAFRGLLDVITEMMAEGSEGPGILEDILSFAQNEGARVLAMALEVLRLIIKYREPLGALLSLTMRMISSIGDLVSTIFFAVTAPLDLIAPRIKSLTKDLKALIKLYDGVKAGLLTVGSKREGGGPDRTVADNLGRGAKLVVDNINKGAGSFFSSFKTPSAVTGAARSRVLGAPTGAGGGTTNSTTNATTNSNVVNIGQIQVGKPGDVGGVVGGLTGSARAGGGG